MPSRLLDLGLVVVGVAFAAGAYGYGLGRHGGTPGDGLFPFLSALVLVAAVVAGMVPTRSGSARTARIDVPWVALVGLCLALAGYAAVLSTVGFPLATSVLLLVLAKIVDRALSWRRALVVTVLLAVGAYLVFTRALGVPLPAGVTGF